MSLSEKKNVILHLFLTTLSTIMPMDSTAFSAWMDPSRQLSFDEWVEMKEAAAAYPYCSLLQLRVYQWARHYEKNADRILSLHDVAHLSLTDSTSLDIKLPLSEKSAVPVSQEPEAAIVEEPVAVSAANQHPLPQPEPQPEPEQQPSVDIFKEINSYQETSFKTAPKSVILSKFLAHDTEIEAPDEDENQVSVEELGKRSVVRDDDICTETLAAILEQQGKIDEACDMYEKLMGKYPEKSATFALRIANMRQSGK